MQVLQRHGQRGAEAGFQRRLVEIEQWRVIARRLRRVGTGGGNTHRLPSYSLLATDLNGTLVSSVTGGACADDGQEDEARKGDATLHAEFPGGFIGTREAYLTRCDEWNFQMLLKAFSTIVGILMLAWLALLFSSRAILVSERVVESGLREKLVCTYFAGSRNTEALLVFT